MSDQQPATLPLVEVSAEALCEVISALNQPIDNPCIREMQATRNVDRMTGNPNPIDTLIEAYKTWYSKHQNLINSLKKSTAK